MIFSDDLIQFGYTELISHEHLLHRLLYLIEKKLSLPDVGPKIDGISEKLELLVEHTTLFGGKYRLTKFWANENVLYHMTYLERESKIGLIGFLYLTLV